MRRRGPLGCGPRTGRGMGRCPFLYQRQGMSKAERLELLKEDKKAIEKKIASFGEVENAATEIVQKNMFQPYREVFQTSRNTVALS